MKYISYKDAPKDTPIWACAYNVNNESLQKRYYRKPVKGKILDAGYCSSWYEFYEFRKDGETLRESGAVIADSRFYADTEQECKEIYNDLVKARIMRLNEIIDEAKEDYI